MNKRLKYIFTKYISMLFILALTISLMTGCNTSKPTNEAVAIITTNNETHQSETTTNNNANINTNANTAGTTEKETSGAVEFPTSYTKKEYKKLINFDAEFPFLIKVNRIQNWVAIYGIDYQGRYSVPYKIFKCSVGLDIENTTTGVFKISDKYDWRLMVDGTYGRYAMRINGPIMIHSVPYYTTNKNDLEVEQYNKLGSPASLGCIRLNVKNVKWIYDNCAPGTTVVVYDSEAEIAPLEFQEYPKAVSKGKKAGWDPTDPDKKNPWNK